MAVRVGDASSKTLMQEPIARSRACNSKIEALQSGSSGLVQCAQSLSVGVSNTSGDGNSNNSGNSSGNSDRRRRTGLSTVMQRPVINQELVMEVEARMNRAYLPPRLLPTHLRGPLPHHRKSSLYHTSTGCRRIRDHNFMKRFVKRINFSSAKMLKHV
ncbi:PREDICTED: uncharacterized protein LOC106744321 [Dinoponera quadriceps]|uniref:Uncharacterized protein LOC106744321 n=1 Tax=Dinoponera quadriceps TaxID=609295 RepID=A0A6P3X9C9_DINQU|nr:PREDICTED: uncharacterized protein LOC106744321 [Dinoponera quadriceps]